MNKEKCFPDGATFQKGRCLLYRPNKEFLCNILEIDKNGTIFEESGETYLECQMVTDKDVPIEFGMHYIHPIQSPQSFVIEVNDSRPMEGGKYLVTYVGHITKS